MSFLKAKAYLVTLTTLLSCRGFSSSPKKLPRLKFVNTVHSRYDKRMIVAEAQKALREYLHCTKSLPFVVAELIANNSLVSLSTLFPKIRFSSGNLAASVKNLLRYEPINEFEFFLESIGIDYRDVHRFLPPKTFFFSQDRAVLDAACTLFKFGFPWSMSGALCVDDISVFRTPPLELTKRLSTMKSRYGLDNLSVAGIVLAFPYLLRLEGEYGAAVDETFYSLKRVLVGLGVESCVEGNVASWYAVCCKVKTFYDLGCEKRSVAEFMCENRDRFLECTNEVLTQKVEYFLKFGVERVDVGMLLLQCPALLSLDLETPVMSVLGFLQHFGLDEKELLRVRDKCAYVLGRNEMANLPYVMKALDLQKWFIEKISCSNGLLLSTYALRCPDEGTDKEFDIAWKNVESSRFSTYTITKFVFLRQVGFGENILTIKILNRVRGSSIELRERFDCLLSLGFNHSKICLMVRRDPDILSQSPIRLEENVKFLRQGLGLMSLELIASCPTVLQFDLERIKRRLGVYYWLRELGLCTRHHSITYMIKNKQERFIRRLYKIHPAAPKHFLERF